MLRRGDDTQLPSADDVEIADRNTVIEGGRAEAQDRDDGRQMVEDVETRTALEEGEARDNASPQNEDSTRKSMSARVRNTLTIT